MEGRHLATCIMNLTAGTYIARLETWTKPESAQGGRPFVMTINSPQPCEVVGLVEEDTEWVFVLDEHAEKHGHCDVCSKVLGHSGHDLNGLKWCNRCFVCVDCSKPIEGSFAVRPNGG